jgi:glycosyltransferase involved in cell wall biosynthesis
MRVVYSHNYSATGIRAQVAAGQYPAQHLYGAQAFESAPHVLLTTDHRGDRPLTRVSERVLRLRVGDLRDELSIRRIRPRVDLVFAGEPLHVVGLAQLPRRRRPPLVAVFHQPAPLTAWWRRVVAGFDGIVCLSARVRDQLIREHGRDPETTIALGWGPDRSRELYPPAPDGDVVVAAGKTGRDFGTLVRALDQCGAPARLWTQRAALSDVPAQVEVREPQDVPADPGAARQFAWIEARDALAAAAVIAIPLASADRLTGLSELADALALGKPVVMTRNPFIDVDIEAVGCGRFVDVGDVDGWAKALDELMSDATLRAEMGAAGRRYVDTTWNADAFAAGVLELCTAVVR